MSGRILLENIVETVVTHQHGDTVYRGSYCSVCGEKIRKLVSTKEYVCEACRHLVGEHDEYCPFCGRKLSVGSQTTEHHFGGIKLTDELFATIKEKINGVG